MMVYFNGQFLPAEEAKVSIFDRACCYGDGLFETLRVSQGRPFRWSRHLGRLQAGARLLGIRLPEAAGNLEARAAELIGRTGLKEALLRIQLSRGTGPRGYSAQGARQPWLAMSLHETPLLDPDHPKAWRLARSTVRVAADDPLSQIKSCNKLLQILARTEAEARDADEALLLNTNGEVAEAAGSNLFWIDQGTIRTPPLSSAALPGITREVVLALCAGEEMPVEQSPCWPPALFRAEGVFLTLSSYGIVEAVALEGQPLSRSPITGRLHRLYQRLVCRECGTAAATD